MLKHKIILAFFIFALVPSGGKIYGQSFSVTMDSVVRKDIYQILLDEGMDSILLSNKLTRNDVSIVVDTGTISNGNSYSVHGERGNRNGPGRALRITAFIKKNAIISNSHNEEKGIHSILVNGKISSQTFDVPDKIFSFKRSRLYNTVYESDINEVPKSFWDSTAKPILVTLGAIAVIALFFLVRG